MSDQTQFPLDDSRLPRAWYNINPDLQHRCYRPSIRTPDNRSPPNF